MEVRAIAKNLRISPSKLKLVVDQIKTMDPAKAIRVLDFVPKKSAPIVKKVILSAIANAKNNHGLSQESLRFKEIVVSKGQVFKRFRPVARGRAHSILRRLSHVSVVLEGETKKKVSEVSQVSKVAEESKEGKNAK